MRDFTAIYSYDAGVKHFSRGYDCNAVTYAKLPQQNIVAFVHCKGCDVVYNV